MNRLEPPEPDYTDDEWGRAEQLLIEERIDLGWSETESRVAIDDYLIAEKCEQLRADREATWACDVNKRRREES